MTHAQSIAVVEKVTPSDMVYFPDYKTLVMLQWQPFPTPLDNYQFVFLNWEPYRATPYNIKGIYESAHFYKYYSLDRLAPKDYVAAGGDYWFEKDIHHKSSTCYTVDSMQVSSLPLASPVYYPSFYSMYTFNITTGLSILCESFTMTADCVTY